MTFYDLIQRRLRAWTIPVVSSSAIHVGIVLATLSLAFHWTPQVIFVQPVELLAPEPPPPPVPTPPPRPKPVAKPVAPPVPPPRETPPPRPEPEIARPAPPPEPAKVPEPPQPVVEAPKPPPVAMAPSPQPDVKPVETKPVETKPVEAKKEKGSENGVVAIAPEPATAGDAAAPARAPAREPEVAAAPSRAPGVSGPLVVARPGEVSRPARPSGGYQVIPPYPASARQQRIEGTTLLKVLVLADGRVGNIAVQKSAGHPDLDQAAADAVRQWHFDPARKGAEPVAMWVLLPVEFHLKD